MKWKLAAVLLTVFVHAKAQDHSFSRKQQFNIENGLAIGGYDPVAYFKTGKAKKGKKELAVSHDGITYYFSSLENRQIFQKSPSNYEPQYGGWCAFAMARGEKVSIDPETFKILDNKLYVFYNKFFNNTLKSWNKDEANLKKSADKNWSRTYHN
jgi:YHS domain-containing protein